MRKIVIFVQVVMHNVDRVSAPVEGNPKTSCKRRSQELMLTKSTVHRILRKDLNLVPYLIPVKQALSAAAIEARREMCVWMQNRLDANPDWLNHLWFSDESHFHLVSAVNRQSNVCRGNQRPEFVSQWSLHSPRVTV